MVQRTANKIKFFKFFKVKKKERHKKKKTWSRFSTERKMRRGFPFHGSGVETVIALGMARLSI
jgi:hypothetical protein